ncbi:hypothetical protein QVD99_000758 [Batrachochytrium dendrobatidis]|nr:hypothetical protein QVD99_000758 [Batrachochytrium dendrobatidis]
MTNKERRNKRELQELARVQGPTNKEQPSQQKEKDIWSNLFSRVTINDTHQLN